MSAAGVHPEYSTTINNEIRSAKKAGDTLTSEDLLEILSDQWKIAGEGEGNVPIENAIETSLTSAPGAFTNGKLQCWHCGEFGHTKKDCPIWNRLKCTYCGGVGHLADGCFKNPKNVDKVPD